LAPDDWLVFGGQVGLDEPVVLVVTSGDDQPQVWLERANGPAGREGGLPAGRFRFEVDDVQVAAPTELGRLHREFGHGQRGD
jgi:hypothetical protein